MFHAVCFILYAVFPILSVVVCPGNLKNVIAVHTKVEQYNVAEQFDIISSRAFADIKKMTKLTSHLIKDGGKFIAMKGPDVMSELVDISLPFEHHDITVPFLEGTRKIIEIKNS